MINYSDAIQLTHCWFNGKHMQLKDVKISPLDFGFIHSDATYDVMRVVNGEIAFSEKHMSRFTRSCEQYHFENNDDLMGIANRLIEINSLDNAFVWVMKWRGTPPDGNPRSLEAPTNTLVYVKPYYGISGSDIALTIDKTHQRVTDASYSQSGKNFGWIEFNMAQRSASAQGYDSALLLDDNGFVTEGAGFGICITKNGWVFSPKSNRLDSITIEVIQDICNEYGIHFSFKDITVETLLDADECMICSTSGGITRVKEVDDTTYTHEHMVKILKTHYEEKLCSK